jgi:Lrp/AsnC family transcriptional regulator for asnA, asnC and gidA
VAKVARDQGDPHRAGQRSVASGSHRGRGQYLNGPRRPLAVGEVAAGGDGRPGDDDRPVKAVVLDEVSKRIIEELQQDGRRSYAALAKSVGLSEAAVRQRVQRLLDSGVMQIVAVTDPTTVGFSRQAMIGIRADGDIRQIAERLSALPELEYVVVCAGSFDLLVELVCEDDEHLLQLLNESVRTVPGVRETETFVYLRLIKQTYGWGTR